MKKSKLLAISLVLISLTIHSQETKKDESKELISRGTFFTGLNSNLALGIALPDGQFLVAGDLKPRIGFFIKDRMSLGVSYQGVGHSSPYSPRIRLYHRGEVELDYYWYAKKNLFLYSKTGLRLAQEQTQGFGISKRTVVDLKLGAGVSWRFKKLPCLGINIEAAYYLDPSLRRPTQKFPEITVGISYFFKAKKARKKQLSP